MLKFVLKIDFYGGRTSSFIFIWFVNLLYKLFMYKKVDRVKPILSTIPSLITNVIPTKQIQFPIR